jgi:zinc transporter ZupT
MRIYRLSTNSLFFSLFLPISLKNTNTFGFCGPIVGSIREKNRAYFLFDTKFNLSYHQSHKMKMCSNHSTQYIFRTLAWVLLAGAALAKEEIQSSTLNRSTEEVVTAENNNKPWGRVIGFSILINVATLSGVLLLIPAISKQAGAWVRSLCWDKAVPDPTPTQNEHGEDVVIEQGDLVTDEETENLKKDRWHLLDIFIPSFASGALLSTSVFLVIPEALTLIQTHILIQEEANEAVDEEHDEHGAELSTETVWKFGASLLGGFLLPLFFDAVFSNKQDHYEGDHDQTIMKRDEEGAQDGDSHHDTNEDSEENHSHSKCQHSGSHAHSKVGNKNINISLVLSILIGDALHNFCDGVFVGVALSLCENATAYTMIAITLYHEIAQELADYFLLTRHAGLRPCVALPLNFCSGMSIMLGGIVVLSVPVSDMTIGVILSVASGVYIYIAACECLPRVNAVVRTSKDRVTTIAMFILGAVPIGLALLNHSHCEAEDH